MTRRKIWRDMTKFWGLLFGINFALGVATGLTMEFQFGMNWAFYSHYVGDVFGAPLAIEGLMAFFLEATLVGLFFFGWTKLKPGPPGRHLVHGARHQLLGPVDPDRQWLDAEPGRLRVQSRHDAHGSHRLCAVLFNPVAQAKFVHTVAAGYTMGAVFVLAISAWYILKNRHLELAKRSFAIASAFGLAAALSVVVLGDESGYTMTEQSEDEARRHRGHVGDRARTGRLHPRSASRTWRRARPSYRDPHSVGHGAHRHPLARHQRCPASPNSWITPRPASATASSPMMRSRRSRRIAATRLPARPSPRARRISATRCF